MMETNTGVLFHPTFSGKEWDIIGNKFRRFPGVMEGALKKEGVRWFIPEKVSEELLLKIHTSRLVEDLKRAWYCEGVMYSVGGCVEAAEKMLSGEIKNALVFTAGAGHHAERDFAWGGPMPHAPVPQFTVLAQGLDTEDLRSLTQTAITETARGIYFWRMPMCFMYVFATATG